MSRADRERLAAYMGAVMAASAAAEQPWDVHANHRPEDCDECAERICEEEGHDFRAEDIADGVVGGGAAHVMAIYCDRCGAEGEPDDLV